MFFTKVISVLCLIAIAIAICFDLLIFAMAMMTGSFGIFVRGRFGWVYLYAVPWLLAFVIGLVIVRRFHIGPFIR